MTKKTYIKNIGQFQIQNRQNEQKNHQHIEPHTYPVKTRQKAKQITSDIQS